MRSLRMMTMRRWTIALLVVAVAFPVEGAVTVMAFLVLIWPCDGLIRSISSRPFSSLCLPGLVAFVCTSSAHE